MYDRSRTAVAAVAIGAAALLSGLTALSVIYYDRCQPQAEHARSNWPAFLIADSTTCSDADRNSGLEIEHAGPLWIDLNEPCRNGEDDSRPYSWEIADYPNNDAGSQTDLSSIGESNQMLSQAESCVDVRTLHATGSESDHSGVLFLDLTSANAIHDDGSSDAIDDDFAIHNVDENPSASPYDIDTVSAVPQRLVSPFNFVQATSLQEQIEGFAWKIIKLCPTVIFIFHVFKALPPEIQFNEWRAIRHLAPRSLQTTVCAHFVKIYELRFIERLRQVEIRCKHFTQSTEDPEFDPDDLPMSHYDVVVDYLNCIEKYNRWKSKLHPEVLQEAAKIQSQQVSTFIGLASVCFEICLSRFICNATESEDQLAQSRNMQHFWHYTRFKRAFDLFDLLPGAAQELLLKFRNVVAQSPESTLRLEVLGCHSADIDVHNLNSDTR